MSTKTKSEKDPRDAVQALHMDLIRRWQEREARLRDEAGRAALLFARDAKEAHREKALRLEAQADVWEKAINEVVPTLQAMASWVHSLVPSPVTPAPADSTPDL